MSVEGIQFGRKTALVGSGSGDQGGIGVYMIKAHCVHVKNVTVKATISYIKINRVRFQKWVVERNET